MRIPLFAAVFLCSFTNVKMDEHAKTDKQMKMDEHAGVLGVSEEIVKQARE